MRTDRYWQNWDSGTAAERIDHYWSNDPFEVEIRQQQALDAKLACGTGVPVFEAGAGSGLMAASLFAAGVTRTELYVGATPAAACWRWRGNAIRRSGSSSSTYWDRSLSRSRRMSSAFMCSSICHPIGRRSGGFSR